MGERTVTKEGTKSESAGEMLDRLRAMSRGRKIVLIVFLIWAVQAIPKWLVAILGDGETSATIMRIFITPRA